MNIWIWFGYWLLTLLGLLWVKRVTNGSLRCNITSAAIAAAVFIGINFGVTYLCFALYHQMSDATRLISFLFIALGLIPTAAAIALFLGGQLIPGFKIGTSDIVRCSAYLTVWTFITLTLVSLLKILGFLLVGLLFGCGIPRFVTKTPNEEYYYH
jgi:hypothetical protein